VCPSLFLSYFKRRKISRLFCVFSPKTLQSLFLNILASFLFFFFFFGFFFLFNKGKMGNGNYTSGSFPQLILTEERNGQVTGMLPKMLLKAAHLASWCALKLALSAVEYL